MTKQTIYRLISKHDRKLAFGTDGCQEPTTNHLAEFCQTLKIPVDD